MKSCYKLLSILMILILITGCSSISYAVEDSKTEPQIKLENNTLYTYGVPILIKKDKAGDTNVYRDDGSQELLKEKVGNLTIYGGGKNESITGNVSITVDGASYSRIYGGGWSDGSKAADVQGNVSITVKGNTNANTIYGGGYAIAKNGNASANVSGTVTVNVPAVPKSNHEFFYGGGSAQVTGKYDAAANVGQVRLHAIGRIREVNGGGSATVDKTATGNAEAVVKSSVSLQLEKADIREVYSGGYASGPNATAHVGSVETKVDDSEVMILIGGGRANDGGQADVAGSAKIHLKDCSNLYGYVHGGGNASSGGSAKTGSVELQIENCIIPIDEQFGSLVAGSVISGGSASGEGANADISGPVQLSISGGSGAGNIYGSGEASDGGSAVTGESQINITDYEGCNYAGYEETFHATIYAGGDVDSGKGSTATADACRVEINDSILENVWGGMIVSNKNPESIAGESDLLLYQSKVTNTITCFDTITLNQPQHLTAFLYKGENRPTQLIAQGFSQGDILITCDDTDSAADWFSLQNGTLSYEVGESASIWKIGNLTNTITATAGEHGAISPSGTCTVNQGEDAEFKITPDSGYRILTVEVDGKTVELSDGTYRFTDVKEDHRIHAEFETIANPAPPYIPPAPPTPDIEAPTVSMEASKEVTDSLLDDQDLQDIKNGSKVSFKLEATVVPEKDLDAVISKALEAHLQDSGQTVAANLDINLIKVKDNVESKVSNAAKKVRVIVQIPETFLDESGLRQFSLIRLHKLENGAIKTDLLPDLDDDPATVTVETDLFSVYTLVYREEDPMKNARLAKGVKATTLKLSSSRRHGSITVKWVKSKGFKVDGYEVFRSTKKNSGYGTKPFYKTTKRSYKNTKRLRKGTRYYYKVRGYRTIGGTKFYTKWSNKAYRVAI
ncbi:MAG: InlB B-repeat-containing protein [Emergencia timonensis]|mgnify:FL=1|uniref:InlB B-repeat-containing protein n=1 Tax=Emergencia timonensis TaxID=1776384 RepID=UPI00082BCF9F|nr:hypothetical protein [Emergencia timonensis]WNX88544.1 hypothetical protein RVY71_20515 [Emergencia timonensis]